MKAILAFLGIVPEIIGIATDPLRRAYEKLLTILFVAIAILAVGFIANVVGYKEINIGLASMFALLTAILWWRPQQVAWVATMGGIIGKLGEKNDISDGTKWLLMEFYKIFKTVLLIGTIVLFYLSFIPFRANPDAFFVLIAGSIVTSLLAERLEIAGKTGQKLGFYGACVIMGLALVSLIPSGFWGTESSFMSTWIAEIKAKEGSIFVLALFLTTIFTLIDERGSAINGKGHYSIIIFLIIGFTSIMFAPTALDGAWSKYGWQGSAYGPPPLTEPLEGEESALSGDYGDKTPKTVRYEIVLTEPGVWVEVENIPDLSSIILVCPDDVILRMVYDGHPEESPDYDCSEDTKLTPGEMRNLKVWVVLKEDATMVPRVMTLMAEKL